MQIFIFLFACGILSYNRSLECWDLLIGIDFLEVVAAIDGQLLFYGLRSF